MKQPSFFFARPSPYHQPQMRQLWRPRSCKLAPGAPRSGGLGLKRFLPSPN
jgi:hypothetical protein